MKTVYFDNASTTAVSVEVLQTMLPAFTQQFGNSNSVHSMGREASKLVDNARDKIASFLNVSANEIYFTASGSEANNWAIRGIAKANANKGNHIIVSQFEHHSVLKACESLEKEGFKISTIKISSDGLIDLADLMRKITPRTVLASVMSANNEVGTIQNIKAIAKTCHEKGVIFHTDAVQLFGNMNLDCNDLDIDAMTISAHKLYGPKGAGVLFVRNKIEFGNLIFGGSQERNKRGATLDVPAIVGFGKAAEIAHRDMKSNNNKLKLLSQYFTDNLRKKVDDIKFFGNPHQKLPQIVSVGFSYIDAESLLMLLDLKGICVSAGAACSSNSLKPSHVIKAMGFSDEIAKGVIRFSFSINNTYDEIDYCISVIEQSVAKLREISPLTKKRG